MTINKNIRCETEKCINAIVKYGEQYHRVHDAYEYPPLFMPDAIAVCEQCGGHTNGKEWSHVCKGCGKTVNPGELVGLFVPHLCKECLNKAIENDKRAGRICRMCHEPYCLCCC
jgi:hypothetical protein